MKIIDNISSNHNISIQNILTSADHLLLVSPFLTEDFDEFIHDIAVLDIKKITLITTLKNNSPDLFKKANSIYSFALSCIQNNVTYEIRIDNLLHGKLYIALKNDVPVTGIITSANFTVRGLSVNHEWGIEINDSTMLQNTVNDLYKVSSEPLSQTELAVIVKEIDDYAKANPPIKEDKPLLDVTKHIKKKLVEPKVTTPDFDSDVRYFLKPVGSSDHPYSEDRVIPSGIIEMHFSKRRPSAVKPGDILICYGVGVRKLLGYFKVRTAPYFDDSDNDRWPWRVEAENLSPEYSQNWASYDNTLYNLQSAYGADKVLTYVGGKSLGALNFGADKIQLNEEFAKFLIGIIDK